MDQLIEDAILAHHAAGDHDAATTLLIKSQGPEIIRYLVARLDDRERAREAFSVFAEAIWRGMPAFSGRSSVRVWAFVIARNAAADQFRERYRPEHARRVEWDTSRVHAVAEQVRTETLECEKTTNQTRIAALREQLSEEDRALLFLRVDRRMSWENVAEAFLDCDPDPADTRREAARLRKRFQLVKERLHALVRDGSVQGAEAAEATEAVNDGAEGP